MSELTKQPVPHFTPHQRAAVFTTMSDGILTVSGQMEITYLNPAAEKLFGVDSQNIISKNISCLTADKKNKPLDRFLQNAQKGNTEKTSSAPATITYYDGTKQKIFDIRMISDGEGFLLLVKDITPHNALKKTERDCAMIFSGLITCICIYLFIWSLLEFTLDIHLKTSVYTIVIQAIAFLLFLEIIFFTSLTPKDIGIFVRPMKLIKTLLHSIPIGMGACILLVLFNVALQTTGHGMKPYFIGGSWAGASSYIFTAVFQEFLSRGVIQNSVKTLMRIKYQKFFGIFLTSLLFALMHLPFGSLFMTGALLMSVCLGIIYEKQKNIWGCAFLHWCVGYLAMAMFF